MGVYWAKPTLEDIASQRAMLERGEEKRRVAKQEEERERLRNTFAAAALTGLLSNVPRYQLGPLTEQSFEIADEMIRQSANRDWFQKLVDEEKRKMDDDPLDFKKKILTDEERDAIHDGMYCLNVYCNARQSGDVLAVKLRGAAETLRSLLERC